MIYLSEEVSKYESKGMPNAKAGQIVTLVEKLSVLGGAVDKEGLAHALGIKPDSLRNPLKSAEMLSLIRIEGNNIELKAPGEELERSNENDRRTIFGKQVSQVEPFRTIIRALQKN